MSDTDHPRPSRDNTHQRPAHGCHRRVQRHQLACARDWARVSRATQRRVYAAYRSGSSEAHLQAMKDAISEMNRTTPNPEGEPA